MSWVIDREAFLAAIPEAPAMVASCEAWEPKPTTRAERRVLAILAILADGDWHPESEIRTARSLLEKLWLSGAIQGAMYGVGAYPEHRLWRLGRDPTFPPLDPSDPNAPAP